MPHQKIAIIRCNIVSETCPGFACVSSFNNKTASFQEYDETDSLIAVFTCGGCSGRRVSRLCASVQKHGATTVHLSSCMCKGQDGEYLCPHIELIKNRISAAGLDVVERTHH